MFPQTASGVFLKVSGDGLMCFDSRQGTQCLRAGEIVVNQDGQLLLSTGVDTGLNIGDPANLASLAIDDTNTVTYTDGDNNVQTAGQISLSRFMSPSGLKTFYSLDGFGFMGVHRSYVQTDTSGERSDCSGSATDCPGFGIVSLTKTILKDSDEDRSSSDHQLKLSGNGYFPLEQPDGNLIFTQDGNFMIDQGGLIRHKTGLLYAQEIKVPVFDIDPALTKVDEFYSILVSSNGNKWQNIGRIFVAAFADPTVLTKISSDGIDFFNSSSKDKVPMSYPGDSSIGLTGSLVADFGVQTHLAAASVSIDGFWFRQAKCQNANMAQTIDGHSYLSRNSGTQFKGADMYQGQLYFSNADCTGTLVKSADGEKVSADFTANKKQLIVLSTPAGIPSNMFVMEMYSDGVEIGGANVAVISGISIYRGVDISQCVAKGDCDIANWKSITDSAAGAKYPFSKNWSSYISGGFSWAQSNDAGWILTKVSQ